MKYCFNAMLWYIAGACMHGRDIRGDYGEHNHEAVSQHGSIIGDAYGSGYVFPLHYFYSPGHRMPDRIQDVSSDAYSSEDVEDYVYGFPAVNRQF